MCEKLTPCPYLYLRCYDKMRVFTADGKSYDSCEKCRYKNKVEDTEHPPSLTSLNDDTERNALVKILAYFKGVIIED